MASASSIILPTMIILCMRVNNLPVVHAINVIPVWNATSAQNDSWPCLLSYDYVANPDVISFHGAPFQMCRVQIISSLETAALIQLPETHFDTFLYAERQGDLHGCQNRYIAITEPGPCTNVFIHPKINLYLQGNITILMSEISKNIPMNTCSEEESETKGDKTMGENQTKQCATLDFIDTISCVLDENQICSFHFPSACSSIIEDRSVEFHCHYLHSIQRLLVTYPVDIVALEFTQQNILEINGNPFLILDKLKQLILEYNRLSFLHHSVFSGLNSLMYLSLKGNQLVTLEIALFQNLTELVILVLSENNLRSFHSDTFMNLVNLNKLYLGRNNLVDIPNSTFSHLRNLSLLDLSNNKLQKLSMNIFEKLQNLSQLYLYENQIISLDNDLFQDTNNLTILSLRNNNLTVLPNGIFRMMNNLEFLILGNNCLASLEKDLFNEINNLVLLDLWNNSLKHLPKLRFLGCTIYKNFT